MTDTAPMPTPTDNLPRMIPVAKVAARMGISRQTLRAASDAGRPIPAGMHLDHTCRNRGCVNPAHLEPVTQRENTLRGMAPNAMAIKTGKCCRGHARATFGRLRSNGSTECTECQRLFKARWRARNRAMAQAVSS